MHKVTEQPSRYRHLEKMSTTELLDNMNREDQTVAGVVRQSIPYIIPLVDIIADKMAAGGRLFYLGAGTSGRLGILDASECPPTFGVPPDMVIGLIAGGDVAIRESVEYAEDNDQQAWADLTRFEADEKDVVIGIAASGTTPYVVGGLRDAQLHGLVTGCITCNPDAEVAAYSDHPIAVVVGPEFVTGSTRLKAGTAQKMVLNMISTSVMIKLGRVHDNRMVDMQLTNNKLMDRGTRMLMHNLGVGRDQAKEALLEHGSVRAALVAFGKL